MKSNLSSLMGRVFVLALLGGSVSCGKEDHQVFERVQVTNGKWTTGAGPVRGHEDLTRLGIDRANQILAEETGNSEYFPTVSPVTGGLSTGHPIVQGNYHSDFPNEGILSFYGLSSGSSSGWHDSPHVQNVHFLRNRNEGIFESAFSACLGATENIVRITKKGMDHWREGQVHEGNFWIGHALHIIQDSFSMAHTKRDGHHKKEIVDICTYRHDLPGVCYHPPVSEDDRIWKNTLPCQTDPGNRGSSCLKDEAREAVMASVGYLLAVARLREGLAQEVDSTLRDYFSGHSFGDHGGFLSCSNLNADYGVTNLQVVSHDFPGNYCDDDFKRIDGDLNKGAGGKFINLCYKKGRSHEAIVDLKVITGQSRGISCGHGWQKNEMDLNEGAGGDYIFLCYKLGATTPLSQIKVTTSSSSGNKCGEGWTWIPEDLNKRASGDYIHLCYRR